MGFEPKGPRAPQVPPPTTVDTLDDERAAALAAHRTQAGGPLIMVEVVTPNGYQVSTSVVVSTAQLNGARFPQYLLLDVADRIVRDITAAVREVS